MPRLRRLAVLTLILITVIMVIVSVSPALFPASPVISRTPASDFTVTAYDETPLGGSVFQLSAARNFVVVVNFWRTDCAPCREQAATLETLWQQRQSQGLIVVGLNQGDETPGALRFISDLGLTYLVGPDEGLTIAQAYAVQTLPTTVVVGPDGKLAWSRSGVATQLELEGVIAKLTSP